MVWRYTKEEKTYNVGGLGFEANIVNLMLLNQRSAK